MNTSGNIPLSDTECADILDALMFYRENQSWGINPQYNRIFHLEDKMELELKVREINLKGVFKA